MTDNADPKAVPTRPEPKPYVYVKPEAGAPALGFPSAPGINLISFSEVLASLKEGVRDFLRAPLFGLFFGGVFVACGWLMIMAFRQWDTPLAIIPMAIAFPLIGPFIAVGLYEVSRRLSAGERLSWPGVLGVVFQQRQRELIWAGFVMLFICWIWAYQVRLLLALFLSTAPISTLGAFAETVATTPNGWMFLSVGTVIGAIISFILYSVTVMGVPLLFARDIDIVTAVVTSVATVRRNLLPMAFWYLIVTILMFLAMAPAFFGLLVFLPILGHATWRLYTRAIVQS